MSVSYDSQEFLQASCVGNNRKTEKIRLLNGINLTTEHAIHSTAFSYRLLQKLRINPYKHVTALEFTCDTLIQVHLHVAKNQTCCQSRISLKIPGSSVVTYSKDNTYWKDFWTHLCVVKKIDTTTQPLQCQTQPAPYQVMQNLTSNGKFAKQTSGANSNALTDLSVRTQAAKLSGVSVNLKRSFGVLPTIALLFVLTECCQ